MIKNKSAKKTVQQNQPSISEKENSQVTLRNSYKKESSQNVELKKLNDDIIQFQIEKKQWNQFLQHNLLTIDQNNSKNLQENTQEHIEIQTNVSINFNQTSQNNSKLQEFLQSQIEALVQQQQQLKLQNEQQGQQIKDMQLEIEYQQIKLFEQEDLLKNSNLQNMNNLNFAQNNNNNLFSLQNKNDFTELNFNKSSSENQSQNGELLNNLNQNERSLQNYLTDLKQQVSRWKELYINEIQKYMKIQENLRQFYEDQKCNQQYIQILESKLHKLEQKLLQTQQQLYQNQTEERIQNINLIISHIEQYASQFKNGIAEEELLKLEEQNQIQSIELQKSKERNSDLLAQINVLVNSKEDLQRNLQLSRSELMQLYQKLQDENQNLKAQESQRLAEIQYISHLEMQIDLIHQPKY